MTQINDFDLQDFLPYLLNQAADVTSLKFQQYYKGRYGMLRTEWRVLFHLGRYGRMTAKDICTRAGLHKTKISRAVQALEDKRYLKRKQVINDRRHEELGLTRAGKTVFIDLNAEAQRFDSALMNELPLQEAETLRRCLRRIATL